MRVLATLHPLLSMLHAMRPVAEALRAAGHEVVFSGAPSFAREVNAAGFEYVGAGLDWSLSDPSHLDVLCAELGMPMPKQEGRPLFDWILQALFGEAAGRRMAAELEPILEKLAPALVLRASPELAGLIAAERRQLPHASLATQGMDDSSEATDMGPPIEALGKRYGVPVEDGQALATKYLHLTFTPPAFQGELSCLPPTGHVLRHAPGLRAREPLPPFWPEIATRPVVLMTLGTMLYRFPHLFELAIEALRAEPVSVVMAIGRDQDPARFGALPPNIRMERFVPQAALLPHCAAFIAHGGFIGVLEATGAGVPMVLLPTGGESYYTSMRAEAVGLARVLLPKDRTPQALREAVRFAVGGGLATGIAAFARELEPLPKVEHAVEFLERLARERRPLLRGYHPRPS